MEKTVNELADWLSGVAEGLSNQPLSGVAPLEKAGEHDISFVETARNLPQAMASRAGCLLAPPGLTLSGKTVIRVSNPRYSFARAVELFCPPPARTPGIHPTAQIAEGVLLASDVEIGPLAVIGENSSIGPRCSVGAGCILGAGTVLGEDCVLHPRVTLYPGVRLGNRVILHSGSVIGSDGFGYAYEAERYYKFPQIGTVLVGDDVEIGANTTIDRAALGETRIGRGTKIDNLVQIGHNVQIGDHCVIASLTGISGSAVIEDNVVIAGQVGIGDHARIQKRAILGGQCGILPYKNIRAGQTVWGTPARPIREHLAQQALVARLPQFFERLKPRHGKEARLKEQE